MKKIGFIIALIILSTNISIEYTPTDIIEPVVKEIIIPDITVNKVVSRGYERSLGTFKITHYCACQVCCGKSQDHPDYGTTASGKRVKEGVTIAVDTKAIKLGTLVKIEGQLYEAQDTGSAIVGNVIDIYVNDHDKAKSLGVKYAEVFIK